MQTASVVHWLLTGIMMTVSRIILHPPLSISDRASPNLRIAGRARKPAESSGRK
jgi:hypothetical protein